MELNVLGVHRVDVSAKEIKFAIETGLTGKHLKDHLAGLRLIEVLCTAPPKRFDAGLLGQYAKSKPDGRSQIAYDERFLTADAAREIQPDEAAKASVFRVASFLHFVNSGKPLKYARVEALLPPVTPAPARLRKLCKYAFP